MIGNILKIFWDRINGVEYGSKVNRELDLNELTTQSEIETIISSINNRLILSFYDAFYNLPSSEEPYSLGDRGAFTDVRMDSKIIRVKRGNHGWMDKKWTKISKRELVERIYKSRIFNGGRMRIESRLARRLWIKNKAEKTLVYLYHKVPE